MSDGRDLMGGHGAGAGDWGLPLSFLSAGTPFSLPAPVLSRETQKLGCPSPRQWKKPVVHVAAGGRSSHAEARATEGVSSALYSGAVLHSFLLSSQFWLERWQLWQDKIYISLSQFQGHSSPRLQGWAWAEVPPPC